MNFVSNDGTINTKAKFVYSCQYQIGQYCYEEVRVCQKQQYYAVYWKIKDYVKFLRKQKIQQRILLQKTDYILSVIPNGFLQAVLSKGYLRVYYKKKKLITRCQNRNYGDQIRFTKDCQLILKGQAEMHLTSADWDSERFTYEKGPIPPFQLYDFITKSFTICDVGGRSLAATILQHSFISFQSFYKFFIVVQWANEDSRDYKKNLWLEIRNIYLSSETQKNLFIKSFFKQEEIKKDLQDKLLVS